MCKHVDLVYATPDIGRVGRLPSVISDLQGHGFILHAHDRIPIRRVLKALGSGGKPRRVASLEQRASNTLPSQRIGLRH